MLIVVILTERIPTHGVFREHRNLRPKWSSFANGRVSRIFTVEDHIQTKLLGTLSPPLNRLYTWTKVVLEHVMTIEPQPARPPCDLISPPLSCTIFRLSGHDQLAETMENWIYAGLRGLRGILGGVGGGTKCFLSLHILSYT